MTYKAVGIKTGKVYATGSYPECVRLTNQQTHDEAIKIIRANETYTPTTEADETERLAKEWQLAELQEKQQAEVEKAAREEARRKERKARAEAAVEAKKQLQAELKKQAKREMAEPKIKPHKKTKGEWSSAEEAFVKTNMDMPIREMIDELEKRFGKVVTMSALNNRKYKLRNQYNLPARPANPWTQEDDDYIIKHYHRLTAEEVGKGIGRTKGAIQARVRLLRRSGELDYHQRYEQKQSGWGVSEPERSVGVHKSGKHHNMGVVVMTENIINDKVATHLAICKQLNQTYQEKNADYGDSFSETYQKLGIISAVTRISDKTNRLISLAGKPEAERMVKDETLRDTLIDLAGYAVLTLLEMEEAK